MGYLLNILWHFPFFGFLFALFYALGGLIMCCTIILMPIGLGWLQFARFLLSPFSCAMVSQSDLEKLTGEKQNSAMAAFSLVIRILYFPFGCIAAFFMVFTIAFEFVSIIGIPCGLVWAKSFKTIFNPVNKICVPKAVADEIERMKSADTLSKYTGRSSSNDGVQSSDVARLVSVLEQREHVSVAEQRPQVRMFDDGHLQEIVDNSEMYNAELVEQCRHEIDIRRKSESLKEKVAGFDDGKLREVISSSGMYAEELIYCCQKEFDRREQLYREEEERVLEQARIEREKEVEAERVRRAEYEKMIKEKARRVLKIVAVVAPIIALVCLIIYLCSDTHKYKSAMKLQEKDRFEKAVAKLSRIKESSEYYERAQYNLYLDYLELRDSIAAGEALVNSVRNGNWDVYEAYECYVRHALNKDFPPIDKSVSRLEELLEVSPNVNFRIIAGEMYFNKKQYKKALDIFTADSAWDNRDKGYIGIMYLYGLADLEANAVTAYKYLSQAPDENPFLVHKGDLTLFLRRADNWSVYRNIDKADSYYGMAVNADPDNKAYAYRYKVTQQIIKTKQKHDKISYWDRGKVYWDSYSYDGGSYNGEVMWYGGNGTRGGHGWGWFEFSNKELNIGKFSYCKNVGLHFMMIPRESGCYSIFVGEYKDDVPVSGSYIFDNGTIWTGRFKPTSKYFDLIDGVELDIHGNKVKTIKE